jgi:hypothetical protein
LGCEVFSCGCGLVGFLCEGLFLGRVLSEEGDGEGYEGADGAAVVGVVVAIAVLAVAIAVAGAVVSAHLCVESEVRDDVRCSRTMSVEQMRCS